MEPYMSQKRGNWGTASSTETWNTVYFCGYTCGHTENTQSKKCKFFILFKVGTEVLTFP